MSRLPAALDAWSGSRVGRGIAVVLPCIVPPVLVLMFPASPLAAMLAGAAVLLVSLAVLRSQPLLVTVLVLAWLSLERIVAAALSPGLTPDSLRTLLTFKQLLFPAIALVGLVHVRSTWHQTARAVRVVDLLAISFCALVAVGVLLADAPLADRVLYARRLAILPMVYLAARLLPWQRDQVHEVVRAIVLVGAAVAAFGLLERFVAEAAIWRTAIPAAYYYHLSSLAGLTARGTDVPLDGLPIVFYDFTAGEAHRRMVSTFLESTTLASFLALCALFAAATLRRSVVDVALLILLVAATVLTLSKAGWVILAGGLTYVVVSRLLPRFRDPVWLMSLAATAGGALLVLAIAVDRSNVTTGALAHFAGLKDGIASALAAPLGQGVGVGGNFGSGEAGAESTFGVLLVQLGFPGLVLWTTWILSLAVAVVLVHPRDAGVGAIGRAVGAGLMMFFATAALTESAGGLIGNWVYAFSAAVVATVAVRPAQNEPPDPVEAGG